MKVKISFLIAVFVILLFLTEQVLVFGQPKRKKTVSKRVKKKEKDLKKFIKEDQGDLIEPYIGGFNSNDAPIISVKFKSMEEISKNISPRWGPHSFKEMVLDM